MKNTKINFYKIALFALVGMTVVSCNDNLDEPSYPSLADRPTVSMSVDQLSLSELDDDATTTVDESVATFTLTLDRPHNTTIKYKLEFDQNASTGSMDDVEVSLDHADFPDYGTEGYVITFPANTTTASFDVSAVFDIYAEGTETVRFNLSPMADLNGVVDASSSSFDVTIANSTSDNLVMILDWNGDGEYLGNDNEYHSLSDFDFDLELEWVEAGNAIVLTSYSSSPEEIDFLGGYPDGTFDIVTSLWDVAPVDPMLPLTFEVKLTVAKPGIFVKEIDLTGLWNSATGGFVQGNPDAYQYPVYFVKSTSGTGEAMYDVYDANDALLVSGKAISNPKSFKNLVTKRGL